MHRLRPSFTLEMDGKPLLDERTAGLLEAIREVGTVAGAGALVHMDTDTVRQLLADLAGRLGAEVLVIPGPGSRVLLSSKAVDLLEEYQRRVGRAHMILEAGEGKPVLTVDGVVVLGGKLVAVRRRYPPFKDRYCLPGGVVGGGERTEDAVVREVEEETGLRTKVLGLIGVYSDPARDPRGHTVSVAYALREISGDLRAGDDARDLALLPLKELPPLGFDHSRIVADFLQGPYTPP